MNRYPQRNGSSGEKVESLPISESGTGAVPAQQDDSVWEQPEEDVRREVVQAGLDVDAIGETALRQFLADFGAFSSPRASRRELGAYLRECREIVNKSIQDVADATSFSPREIRAIEERDDGIFPVLVRREKQFAGWLKLIHSNGRRVVRLLRNCPSPPQWYVAQGGDAVTYLPASSDAFEHEGDLPPEAEAVVERLLDALH